MKIRIIIILFLICVLNGCATTNKSNWIEVGEKSICFKKENNKTIYIPIEERKRRIIK